MRLVFVGAALRGRPICPLTISFKGESIEKGAATECRGICPLTISFKGESIEKGAATECRPYNEKLFSEDRAGGKISAVGIFGSKQAANELMHLL